jgi:hypothetical protein
MQMLITWASIGVGMTLSAFVIPGNWPLIIAIGLAIGFLSLHLGISYSPKSARSPVPSHVRGAGSLSSWHAIAAFIAAMGAACLWMLLGTGEAMRLPVRLASTAVFLPGMAIGTALYMVVFTRKMVTR